jgi:hypothetical protein
MIVLCTKHRHPMRLMIWAGDASAWDDVWSDDVEVMTGNLSYADACRFVEILHRSNVSATVFDSPRFVWHALKDLGR